MLRRWEGSGRNVRVEATTQGDKTRRQCQRIGLPLQHANGILKEHQASVSDGFEESMA